MVTGTAFAGTVAIDDELFLSTGQKVRVKNIHAQNTPSEKGFIGQRLALNLNVDLDRIPMQRGDWLLASEPLEPTDRITIEITPEVNLKDSQPVHIYHAAKPYDG